MTEPLSSRVTDRFADFCAALTYEDLPPDIVTAAKSAILDLVGVALIGTREQSTVMLSKAAGVSESCGTATVLGTRWTTIPTLAAMINGHAAHALDYDDFQHKVGTHMSAAVLPATLALAEMRRIPGRNVLTAYVAGFEIGCRLGRVARFADQLAQHGVHSTGFLGHFGAAASCGKVLGLNALQMCRNFGIAAGHASGIMKSLGTMCKAQNAANAAQNGVLSALLAHEGFTGPEQIFDGKQNIFSMFGAQPSPAELIEDLGQHFELIDNTPKVYACSGWRNPIVQASIQIATTHDLDPQNIKKTDVYASADVLRFSNYPQPHTGAEAKFSTEYAAGVALLDRAGGVIQFSDERVKDSALMSICRNVKLETHADLKPHQIRVQVHTIDGRELSHFVEAQKGDPKNPLAREELVAKFRANALAVLPQAHVDQLNAMVWNLEQLDDISELTNLCRSGI